jgi:hypothetical protein
MKYQNVPKTFWAQVHSSSLLSTNSYIYIYICRERERERLQDLMYNTKHANEPASKSHSAVMKVCWILYNVDQLGQETVWAAGPPYNVDLHAGLDARTLPLFWTTPPLYTLKILRSQTVWLFYFEFGPMIYVKAVFNRVTFESQMCVSPNHCSSIRVTVE